MSHSCDETYTLYRERIRRARKEHKCDACKLPIRVGDFYCDLFTLFEGDAELIKRCGACQTTHLHLRDLCRLNGSDLWPDERLNCGLAYDDEWGDDPPDEVAALAFMSDAERGQLLAPKSNEPVGGAP